MDNKILLGVVASIIGFLAYLAYFRDIFAGKTKPHVFSWFVWSLLTGTAFFAQIAKGAGAGAWVTGVTSILCFFVVVLAFFRGEKQITVFDWVTFIGALAGLMLWKLTDNPLSAVIVVTSVDALALAPTIRKAYKKPNEETVSTFALNGLKYVFGLLALESFNATTWLYPASLVVTNELFVLMVLARRSRISIHPKAS